MTDFAALRPRQSQCAGLFGNPTHPAFMAHVAHVPAPFAMAMGVLRIHSIKINKIAEAALTAALEDIWIACGKDQAKIAACHADCFSGDWVVRLMRGRSQLSMHAYALAVDIDAPHNPLGTHGFFTADSLVVKAFERNGFVWGGRWTTRPDGMHFQFATVG